MQEILIFQRAAAQGEISLYRVGDLPPDPSNYKFAGDPLLPEGGQLIIGHSETGHHHVMDPTHVRAAVMEKTPPGMRILQMIVESPTPIVHLREFDTHAPVMLSPGIYQARIARQFDPYREVARRVAD